MTANKELLHEVASLLVEALNLETAPEAIDPQAPLYGDGLGPRFHRHAGGVARGLQALWRPVALDDENNEKIFASLASLADHIAAHRTT